MVYLIADKSVLLSGFEPTFLIKCSKNYGLEVLTLDEERIYARYNPALGRKEPA